MIEIKIDNKSIKLPAWITPGQNQKSISLELGYGREFQGRLGNGVGFNVYPLRMSSNPSYSLNASISVFTIHVTQGQLNPIWHQKCAMDHFWQIDDQRHLP